MAQQLKKFLQEVTWPQGTQNVVFGPRGVAVFAGEPTENQIPPQDPWVLVGATDAEHDDDHPELFDQTFTLICGVLVFGDELGEHAVIGGSTPDLSKSDGRGSMEVEERVRAAINGKVSADGSAMQVVFSGRGTPRPLADGRHLVVSEQTVQAMCSSELYFAAPQRIKKSGSTYSWDGTHCEARFDFKQYRFVSKAGNIPSADPSDGTLLYTGPNSSWSGAATGVVTVFADYNSRTGRADLDGTSGPEVGSYLKGN